MKKSNKEIRELIYEKRLKHYEVANAMEISEITFCKRLRNELSEEGKEKVIDAINRILREDQ